jgi:hypothetical protein
MPWLNVPYQQQLKPGWCLPACVAMVSAYWRQPLSQESVAQWLGTELIGTPVGRITGLVRRGFDVLYTTGSPVTLTEWLNQGVPPILFVRTGDLRPLWTLDTPHAVVLAGSRGIPACSLTQVSRLLLRLLRWGTYCWLGCIRTTPMQYGVR